MLVSHLLLIARPIALLKAATSRPPKSRLSRGCPSNGIDVKLINAEDILPARNKVKLPVEASLIGVEYCGFTVKF